MTVMGTSLVLVMGLTLLGAIPEKVEAASDIEDVCNAVEEAKKTKEAMSDDGEQTLDEDTIEKVWEACGSKPPTDAGTCKFTKIVDLCLKMSTEEVVNHCQEP